jgi:N-acetylglucosamine kinase-like BadF-type ATPase
MTRFFLGIDVGSSKSAALVAGEDGVILGSGRAGPGNHEVVGYPGLAAALHEVTQEALRSAGLTKAEVAGAGFGVSGFDWPAQRAPTMEAIGALELPCEIQLVNDTLLGLIAGTDDGWGIAVVAGSGENCWGMDSRGRVGRMTGGGSASGEYGGAASIVAKGFQAVSEAWSRRGPTTSLTRVMLKATGSPDVAALIEGIASGRLSPSGDFAPLVSRAAEEGDAVASAILRWAGERLGDLVCGVIRQLEFQRVAFDLVEVGGVFSIGRKLTDPLEEIVRREAPQAGFVRLKAPPVVGAVLLAMETALPRSAQRTARATLLSDRNGASDRRGPQVDI